MNQEELSTLNEKVEKTNDLKSFVVEHVGTKINPENEEVTLEMVVEVMAEEFPELMLCVAEENWVRGYQQALVDVDSGRKYMNENVHKKQE